MHYSFDFAQQVHALQPGTLYFLVPRKVGLFGVCCEGIAKQVNYIFNETHLISKGSNAVMHTCIIFLTVLDFFITFLNSLRLK